MILDNVNFDDLNDQNVNLEQIMEIQANQMKRMNQVEAIPEPRSILMEGGRESDLEMSLGPDTIAVS